MRSTLIALCLLFSANLFSQNQPKPCSAPESSQFDFWVGNWGLTYNDSLHASNEVTKDLDGCVIHEHFKDPFSRMNGNSWSVYNAQTKKWQQTWVDNQGGYIVLTGAFNDGKMVLFTEPTTGPKGNKIQYRMVYHNITPQSFDWSWDLTRDEGKTWQANWVIHYQRK